MSSLTVISRIVPLSFPSKEYPSFFKDPHIESDEDVQKIFFEDKLANIEYCIETVYIKEDLSKQYEEDPNFVPLTSDSEDIQNAHNLDDSTGFCFQVPLQIISVSSANQTEPRGQVSSKSSPHQPKSTANEAENNSTELSSNLMSESMCGEKGDKVSNEACLIKKSSLDSLPSPNDVGSSSENQRVRTSLIKKSSLDSLRSPNDIDCSSENQSVRTRLNCGVSNMYKVKSYVNKSKEEKTIAGSDMERSLSHQSDSSKVTHPSRKDTHLKKQSHKVDKSKRYRVIAPKPCSSTSRSVYQEKADKNESCPVKFHSHLSFHDEKGNRSEKLKEDSQTSNTSLSNEVKPVAGCSSLDELVFRSKFGAEVSISRLSDSSSEESDSKSVQDKVVCQMQLPKKVSNKAKLIYKDHADSDPSPLSCSNSQSKFLDKNPKINKKIIVKKSQAPNVCSSDSRKFELSCTDSQSEFLDKNSKMSRKLTIKKPKAPNMCSSDSSEDFSEHERDNGPKDKSPPVKHLTSAPELDDSSLLPVVAGPPSNQAEEAMVGASHSAEISLGKNERETLLKSDRSVLDGTSQMKNLFQAISDSGRKCCQQKNDVKNFEDHEEAILPINKRETLENKAVGASVSDSNSAKCTLDFGKKDDKEEDLVQNSQDTSSGQVRKGKSVHIPSKSIFKKRKNVIPFSKRLPSVSSSIPRKPIIGKITIKRIKRASNSSQSVMPSIESSSKASQVTREGEHSQEVETSASKSPRKLSKEIEMGSSFDKEVEESQHLNLPASTSHSSLLSSHKHGKVNNAVNLSKLVPSSLEKSFKINQGSLKLENLMSVSDSHTTKTHVREKMQSVEESIEKNECLNENIQEMSLSPSCSSKHQKMNQLQNASKNSQKINISQTSVSGIFTKKIPVREKKQYLEERIEKNECIKENVQKVPLSPCSSKHPKMDQHETSSKNSQKNNLSQTTVSGNLNKETPVREKVQSLEERIEKNECRKESVQKVPLSPCSSKCQKIDQHETSSKYSQKINISQMTVSGSLTKKTPVRETVISLEERIEKNECIKENVQKVPLSPCSSKCLKMDQHETSVKNSLKINISPSKKVQSVKESIEKKECLNKDIQKMYLSPSKHQRVDQYEPSIKNSQKINTFQLSVSENPTKETPVSKKVQSVKKSIEKNECLNESVQKVPLSKHKNMDQHKTSIKNSPKINVSSPGLNMKNSVCMKSPSPLKKVSRSKLSIEEVLFSSGETVDSLKSVPEQPVLRNPVVKKSLEFSQKIIKTKMASNSSKPDVSCSVDSCTVVDKVSEVAIGSFQHVNTVESFKSPPRSSIPKSPASEAKRPHSPNVLKRTKVAKKVSAGTKSSLSPASNKKVWTKNSSINSQKSAPSTSNSQSLADREENTNSSQKKVKVEKNISSSSNSCLTSRKSFSEDGFGDKKVTMHKKDNKFIFPENKVVEKEKLVTSDSSSTAAENPIEGGPTNESTTCHKKKSLFQISPQSISSTSIDVNRVKKSPKKEFQFQRKFSDYKKLIKFAQAPHKIKSSASLNSRDGISLPSTSAARKEQVNEKSHNSDVGFSRKTQNKGQKDTKEKNCFKDSDKNKIMFKKSTEKHVPSLKNPSDAKKVVNTILVSNQKSDLSKRSRKISPKSSSSNLCFSNRAKQVVQKSGTVDKSTVKPNVDRPLLMHPASKLCQVSESAVKKAMKVDRNVQVVKDSSLLQQNCLAQEEQAKGKKPFLEGKHINNHLKLNRPQFGQKERVFKRRHSRFALGREEPGFKRRKYSKACDLPLCDRKLRKEDQGSHGP